MDVEGVGKKKLLESQADRGLLMPEYLPAWLPRDHEISWLGGAVGGTRRATRRWWSRFCATRTCAVCGRPVRSSACSGEDIPMRVLSGNRKPDRWAIANCRHQLGAVFAEPAARASAVDPWKPADSSWRGCNYDGGRDRA